MQTEPQEEELTVFTNPNSDEAKELLQLMLEDFNITIPEKMRMALCSLISSLTHKGCNSEFNLNKLCRFLSDFDFI